MIVRGRAEIWIIEEAAAAQFFDTPQHERTRAFLGRVLRGHPEVV